MTNTRGLLTNLALVCSLALFALIVFLWLRSTVSHDRQIEYGENTNGMWQVWAWESHKGRMSFAWGHLPPGHAATAWPAGLPSMEWPRGAGEVGLLPKYLRYQEGGSPAVVHLVVWHDAWLVALTLAFPLYFAVGRYRKLLVYEGCCAKCGYDLLATPNRCPECGTVPEVPSDW